MDKIKKSLTRLKLGERRILKRILVKINSGDLGDLDLKKLKGRKDVFRIRKGKIRVIFYKKDNSIKILSVERRSDKTY